MGCPHAHLGSIQMEEETPQQAAVLHKYSPIALKRNHHQMAMCRLLLGVLAGVVSGILRVEGIVNGLLMFLVANLVGSVVMCVQTRPVKAYFENGLRDVFTAQLFSGTMTYILVWTLVYDIVHIF